MTTDDTPSYAFPEGVLAREVDGEMVLLNLRTEQYYGLDAIGADIVKRLTRQSERSALNALCSEYEVETQVLESDIAELVSQLTAAGLLQRVA